MDATQGAGAAAAAEEGLNREAEEVESREGRFRTPKTKVARRIDLAGLPTGEIAAIPATLPDVQPTEMEEDEEGQVDLVVASVPGKQEEEEEKNNENKKEEQPQRRTWVSRYKRYELQGSPQKPAARGQEPLQSAGLRRQAEEERERTRFLQQGLQAQGSTAEEAMQKKIEELEATIKLLVTAGSEQKEELKKVKQRLAMALDTQEAQTKLSTSKQLVILGWADEHDKDTRNEVIKFYFKKYMIDLKTIDDIDSFGTSGRIMRRSIVTFDKSGYAYNAFQKINKRPWGDKLVPWKGDSWSAKEIRVMPMLTEHEQIRQMPLKTVFSLLDDSHSPYWGRIKRQWKAYLAHDANNGKVLFQQELVQDHGIIKICVDSVVYEHVKQGFGMMWERLWVHQDSWRRSTSIAEYPYEIMVLKVSFTERWVEKVGSQNKAPEKKGYTEEKEE